MPRGHSGKFSQKQCKIHLSMDKLGEQKILEGSFFELSESVKTKSFLRWAPWCRLRQILASLQTSRFELLGGWNVCYKKLKSTTSITKWCFPSVFDTFFFISEAAYKKRYFWKFCKIHRKAPVPEPFFAKCKMREIVKFILVLLRVDKIFIP